MVCFPWIIGLAVVPTLNGCDYWQLQIDFNKFKIVLRNIFFQHM